MQSRSPLQAITTQVGGSISIRPGVLLTMQADGNSCSTARRVQHRLVAKVLCEYLETITDIATVLPGQRAYIRVQLESTVSAITTHLARPSSGGAVVRLDCRGAAG